MNKSAFVHVQMAIIISILYIFIGVTEIYCAEPEEHVINRQDIGTGFEQGYRADYDAVKVVDIYGTWHDMGRQYGYLLSNELSEICSFVGEVMSVSDSAAQKAIGISENEAAQNSYEIRQFIEGMSETSGLSVDQLCLANAVERIAGLPPQCSFTAAFGDYAKDNLVIGRNYDYSDGLKKLHNDVVVTVYHPADGSLATATIGYAGELYAVNGINEKGIFLELNNGSPSTPGVESSLTRVTGTSQLLDVLFKADSIEYMDRFFNTSLCDLSYIINVADSETVRSYEWSQVGAVRAEQASPEGLVVSTNHFVNPGWSDVLQYETPTDETSWMSITRRNNLLNLCNQSKGTIDYDTMMSIMGTDISDGGATDELTVYQMVVEPEILTIWLKVIDDDAQNSWNRIDIGSFLIGA